MAKSDYSITRSTDANDGAELLRTQHYLGRQGVKWKNGYNYMLKDKTGKVCGMCIFTGFPVPELVVGMFGLRRNKQEGMFELSRLVVDSETQAAEYNITSYSVSRAIRYLRKDATVRCILSYADTDHHKGTIYRACNFVDYGLTAAKKDFWVLQKDGAYKKHQRGPTSSLVGEWRPRSRKRRFVRVFDKHLKLLWQKE